MATLIPGSAGVITINSDPVVTALTSDFALTRNIMTKAFIGQAWSDSLNGQRAATFSCTGCVAVENVADLYAAWTAATVPCSIQIGDAAGATDAGMFSGDFNVSNLAFSVSGDGEWDFSFDASNAGDVTYTAATP